MKPKNIFLFIFLIFAVSCNQPDPNPHLKDPIYLDIEKAVEQIGAEIQSKKEELMEVEAALPGLEVTTQAKAKAQRKYFSLKKEIHLMEQSKYHAELRLKSRYIQDKMEYLAAFKKGEKWDPSHAMESYKRNRSLVNSPRIWEPKVKKRDVASKKSDQSSENKEDLAKKEE